MNTYRVLRESRTQQAYFDYVGSLPWTFNGDPFLSADASGERVTVDGTITGFDLLLPSVTAQDIMVERIKAERDRRKLNGVLVSGKWFHTDVFSRTQWLGMVMMGASIPVIQWKTMDGTYATTSQALAAGVFSATATLDATVFAAAEAHRAAMLACADPYTYNFSANWPATYVPV